MHTTMHTCKKVTDLKNLIYNTMISSNADKVTSLQRLGTENMQSMQKIQEQMPERFTPGYAPDLVGATKEEKLLASEWRQRYEIGEEISQCLQSLGV